MENSLKENAINIQRGVYFVNTLKLTTNPLGDVTPSTKPSRSITQRAALTILRTSASS